MKWRCYNTYLWFEVERNLSPPDAFYGIFYVQNPFAAGALPRTPLGELTALPRLPICWGGGSLPLGRGLAAPSPRTLPPLSALRAWRFGPSGFKLSPQTQKPNFAHGRWEICRTNQNTAKKSCFLKSEKKRKVRILEH